MIMTALQSIEKIGNEAVQELRLLKLRNGQAFMINSKDLKSSQCYLEYPDGSIQMGPVFVPSETVPALFRDHLPAIMQNLLDSE
jgi:hypothetical protein